MKSNKGITLLEVIVTISIVGMIFVVTNTILINYYNISKKISTYSDSIEEVNIVYSLFNECINVANKNKEKINIEILSDEHTMISLEESYVNIEFLYDELGNIYSYYNGTYIRELNNIKIINITLDENILKLAIKNKDNTTYKKNYYVINV